MLPYYGLGVAMAMMAVGVFIGILISSLVPQIEQVENVDGMLSMIEDNYLGEDG